MPAPVAMPPSSRRWRLPHGWLAALAGLAVLCPGGFAAAETEGARHAIAMHGEPALPPDFAHVRYVEPAAPKGGRLNQGVLGTFDSLNPFVVKGLAAQNIRGYVVESLLARHYDEPFTLYALLAESVETDDARSFVTFTLDPRSQFSDGKPVTADDVIFSWQILRDKGRPNYRTYYTKVTKAQRVGERGVRFDFAEAGDRELPLILGLMPILAKHATNAATFDETTFTPPIGSGPYVVSQVKPGESVLFTRDRNYWGRDLPINRGLWNFDEIRFDYYRDGNTQFEAFKKGLIDVRAELDPTRWQSAYDFPAARDGRVIKETFTTGMPKGMFGFVFNTRRPLFADIRVREAIATLFDFNWVNHSFFFDQYRRSASFFEGSELSARGRPADVRERELLQPFADELRDDVMEGRWQPPVTDASGRDRNTLQRALTLLEQAGYDLKGTELRNRRTGQQLAFEILTTTRDQERLALAFQRDLQRAGIRVRVRVVDAVQFDRRRIGYDFDMIEYRWDQSLSPGNEQAFYWGSAAAAADGTRNYMGIRSPAVDAMIAALLAAKDRETFIDAVRALDRALMSGFYVVPLFHLPGQWVARWSAVRHPQQTSLYGYLPETWWRSDAPRTP